MRRLLSYRIFLVTLFHLPPLFLFTKTTAVYLKFSGVCPYKVMMTSLLVIFARVCSDLHKIHRCPRLLLRLPL